MIKTPEILLTLLVCSMPWMPLSAQPVIDLEVVADGFNQPVDVTNAGDERLFVVEKQGVIKIIDAAGEVLDQPFLDITDRVRSSGGEQGLLGLAFHPDYSENGFFYVNYTDDNGDTHIARFSRISGSPDEADPASEMTLLTVEQPYANHNGGDLHFGPDGYLYIGLGDGGSGGDPQDYAQNRQSFLGKMLRIDVDNGDPYAIPPGNPFAETDETLDEIWALGLRNPWRFSFDSQTGALWIGDVGQNSFEEIDYQSNDSNGGENYGWDCYEGFEAFELTDDCPDMSELTFPVHAYPHTGNLCSVTGGYVYRGQRYDNLDGYYLYADFCTGEVWGILLTIEGDFVNNLLEDFEDNEIVAFGEGVDQELYVAGIKTGTVYQIVELCAGFETPEVTYEADVLSVPDTFATYQWYLDEAPIVGANSPEFVPTESGPYTVEVTSDIGCIATAEFGELTSVAEAIGIRWWQASPNPFRDHLRLEVELTEPAVFQVKIYDAGGRLVMQDRLDRSSSWMRQYQLQDLESGLYFISLERGKQRVVQKLLKTN